MLFADDGLMFAQSQNEMEAMIRVLTKASEECGLKINKDKSVILIFNDDNNDEYPKVIEGIPVTEETKYLGIKIVNKRDLFREHKRDIIKKAHKMANMTYSIINKSCNKLMIGKTYWKNVALPSILYGLNVVALTNAEVKKLQTIEYGVYRRILGAPRYAPNCALRGEIGSSQMKTRVMKGHLQYIRGAIQSNNELVKKVVFKEIEDGRSKWSKTSAKYLKELKLKILQLEHKKKEDLNKQIQEWDSQQWKNEVDSKTSLQMYQSAKNNIKEETIYDNTPASVVLFQARTNSLPLEDRKRHESKETTCRLCGEETEDLGHFILICTKLSEIRSQISPLQRPYISDKSYILKTFVFDTEEDHDGMERRKEWLYQLWRARKKVLKDICETHAPLTNP